jgi:RNA polymerase sigma factor (TIGR02999 family)
MHLNHRIGLKTTYGPPGVGSDLDFAERGGKPVSQRGPRFSVVSLMPTPPHDVTQLLADAGQGRASAVDQLLPLVYDELRQLAGVMFRQQRAGHTLQPTALVHEAYSRMVGAAGVGANPKHWKNRAHFFAVAATAMRQILSNHARDRKAAKRGGDWRRVTLSQVETPTGDRDVDLVALDEALESLHSLDERQARIVELRFFAEMTEGEFAHVLDVSVSTVEREWRMARAWLSAELRKGSP